MAATAAGVPVEPPAGALVGDVAAGGVGAAAIAGGALVGFAAAGTVVAGGAAAGGAAAGAHAATSEVMPVSTSVKRRNSRRLCWVRMGSLLLTFDGSGQDAPSEVPLQERVDHQDWQGGDDDDGHLNRLSGWWRLVRVERECRSQRTALQHVLAQYQLNRPHAGVVEIQDGVEERVPDVNPVSGSTTCHSTCQSLAPSRRAASSSSRGMFMKKLRRMTR